MSALIRKSGRRFGGALILFLTACSVEKRVEEAPSVETADSLAITLSAPASVRRGADVAFTITVRNSAGRALDLSLAGREIAFDITVSRNDRIYWQRLHGVVVPAILQLKTLQPGEAFELKDVWRADLDPGRYDVAGEILTDVQPLTTPRIQITVL